MSGIGRWISHRGVCHVLPAVVEASVFSLRHDPYLHFYRHNAIVPRMDQAELYDAWHGQDGYTPGKDRPAWVREHREDLMEHLDVDEEIPGEGESIAEYRAWLSRYKATVTRQIAPDESGETPTVSDSQESE